MTRFFWAIGETVQVTRDPVTFEEVATPLWRETRRADSIFTFPVVGDESDPPVGAPLNDLVGKHTFYLYAVDNEGKRDPTPARRSFFVETLGPPEVSFCNEPTFTKDGVTYPVIGEEDTLTADDTGHGGPGAVCWSGEDPDGGVSQFLHKLDDALAFTAVDASVSGVVLENLTEGGHVLFLKAKDDANAESAPVQIRFTVNHDPQTQIQTARYVTDDTTVTFFQEGAPYVPATLPAGSRVEFDWAGEEVDGAIDASFWRILNAQAAMFDSVSHVSLNSTSVTGSDVTPISAGVPPAPIELLGDPGSGYYLTVWGRDRHGREEGTPDSLAFYVNLPPDSVEVHLANGVTDSTVQSPVLFQWSSTDPDGLVPGFDAFVQTRYAWKIDSGGFIPVATTTQLNLPLALGQHTVSIRAFNPDLNGNNSYLNIPGRYAQASLVFTVIP